MMKMSRTDKPWTEIVANITPKESILGYDPTLMEQEKLEKLTKFFAEKK